MNIAVVGLGGVGGYLAANLAKTNHNVVGFARGEHLAKIKQDGLKIIEDESSWSVSLDVRTLDEAQGHFDVVLFCVKSYDLLSSYEAMKNTIDENTTIVSFSNGVEHGDRLRDISDANILDGCVYILSHIHESGIIRKKGKVFAAVFGGDELATSDLKSLFDEAELRCKTPSDIKTAIWKKYIFISAFATLTSYYDKSIVSVYKENYGEAKTLLDEIALVASIKGIDIFDEVQKSLDIAKGLPEDASTSMHLDYQNNKKVELETLSGYIVKEARKLGVQTPLMQKMYEELSCR